MKKFLFIAITALALWSSCTKTPSVSVGPISEEGVSASGGTVTVNVKSDGEWRTSADEGVVIEPSSGSGSQSVSIKVPANTSKDEKDVNVTFYSVLGTSNQDVIIHQKSPGVSVSVDDEQKIKSVFALGDTIDVKVVSDGGWKASADNGITVDPSYSYEKEVAVKVIVSVNDTDGERDMGVKFSSLLNPVVSDSVTVHQKSVNFIVTPLTAEVAAAGGILYFTVTANGGWETVAESGVTVESSSDSGDASVKVTVPENISKEERDVKVTFYSTQKSSLSQTVTIHQKAPNVSAGQPSAGEVAAAGETVTVDVTSDGGFTAPAGDGFKVEPSEWKDSGSKQVKITVDPNATGKERDVKVIFYSKLSSSVSDTVTIHQKSMGISVTPSSRTVSATGGEAIFTVTADGEWKASADNGATVTTSKQSAESLKVTLNANTTGLKKYVKVKVWLTQNSSIADSAIVNQASISISASPEDTTVSVSDNKFDVRVAANGGWEASVGGWKDSGGQPISTTDKVQLSSSEGTGNKSVTVTVPSNATGRERYVEVEFYSILKSEISQTVTIHQNPMSILVSQDEFNDVPAAGDTVNVTVTSDGKWTAGYLNGCTLSTISGSSGESVRIIVPKNTTTSARDVTVKFWLTDHSTVSQIVTFHQKAPSISVTDPTEDVSVEGGDVKVTVTSDGGWTATCDGCTILNNQYSGSGGETVTIRVPQNGTGKERYVKVIFYSALNRKFNQTVQIYQETKSLSVTPHKEEVSASGVTFNATVTFDGDWRSNIASWTDADDQQITTDDKITGVPSSGPGNKEFTITVPENTSNVERYAKIRFISKGSVSVQDSIIIHQGI